ncbi:uncharacterized protein LOC100181252 [Ciona intestinalis]
MTIIRKLFGRSSVSRIFSVRCKRKVGTKKCLLSVTVMLFIVFVYQHRAQRFVQQVKSSALLSLNKNQSTFNLRLNTIASNAEGPSIQPTLDLKNCSNNELVGPMAINPNITPNFAEVENVSSIHLLKDGCYSPTTCIPRQKVAVIIPFKERDAHLKTLLFYLHPMLQRQKISYCIFVAEQFDNGQFNKAMIMNAAFEEAMKQDWFDCIIFHDVDMIPEDDRNLYICGEHPRHISPAIDKFDYKSHYGTEFGGVTGITPEQYRKANGHSNQFWGWGGEDNDMEFRIFNSGMKIIPSPSKIGRYKMIVHTHPWKFSANKFPTRLNKTRVARAKTDGLSDLQYRLVGSEGNPLYTKWFIDIRRIEVKRITLYIDDKPAMDIDIEPGKCRWERVEGKYLDYSIELTNVKEAAPLVERYLKTRKQTVVPPHVKLPSTPTSQFRFSIVENFDDATNLCDKIAPLCVGVQKENSEEKYTLRRSNMPRNIVISGPVLENPPTEDPSFPFNFTSPRRKLFFPNKVAHVRYCPGSSGDYQMVKKTIKTAYADFSMPQHWFKFDVQFTVLKSPPVHIYYKDSRYFEAQTNKEQSTFRFSWPGGKAPNFNNVDTPREYIFQTTQFPISNIPGCYSVESKLADNLNQPLYQWNWWFEVSSGNKEIDARLREEYWRNRSKEQAVKAKMARMVSMQRRKDAMDLKRQREREKKIAKVHMSLKEITIPPADRWPKKEANVDIDEINEAVIVGNGQIKPYDPNNSLPPVVQAVGNTRTYEPKVAVSRKYHTGLPQKLQTHNVKNGAT